MPINRLHQLHWVVFQSILWTLAKRFKQSYEIYTEGLVVWVKTLIKYFGFIFIIENQSNIRERIDIKRSDRKYVPFKIETLSYFFHQTAEFFIHSCLLDWITSFLCGINWFSFHSPTAWIMKMEIRYINHSNKVL